MNAINSGPLTPDQIDAGLQALQPREQVIAQASAALYMARAVNHLREQFPTAAYAWVDVDPVGDQNDTTAMVLRIQDAAGAVVWDDTDPGAEEIESPATDAVLYAAQTGQAIGTRSGSHDVAGEAPDTYSLLDPWLVDFAETDRAAHTASRAGEAVVVTVPQMNGGPTLVAFAVPMSAWRGDGWTFDQADAVKLGPPSVIGPDEFPGPLFDRGQVATVLNQACEDIAQTGDLGASVAEDAMNVLVNATMTYLDDPDANLHTMVDACYDGEYPAILADLQRSRPGGRMRCESCGAAQYSPSEKDGAPVVIDPKTGDCADCAAHNLSRN